jgi:hypothetical protein
MKGALTILLLAGSILSCGGGKKPPADATESKSDSTASEKSGEGKGDGESKGDKSGEGKGEGKSDGEEGKSKASICTGFELDLVNALNNSACEVPNQKATDVKAVDLKKRLQVKLSTSANKVEPGGKVDLIVQFVNKGKEPLVLDFMLDPSPRFTTEAYDAKKKRVDMPATHEPMIPSGVTRGEPSPQTVGRVVIVQNGTAHAKVPWEASRMRWAPEKLKGTPPEMGFPRLPAGPLPKGKYTVKVITPLLNAVEGVDHEISAPKVDIEVGK